MSKGETVFLLMFLFSAVFLLGHRLGINYERDHRRDEDS